MAKYYGLVGGRQHRGKQPLHHEGTRPKADEKRCPSCGNTKPLQAFGLNRNSRDGRNYMCLDCAREYRRRQNGRE